MVSGNIEKYVRGSGLKYVFWSTHGFSLKDDPLFGFSII
jgi:hypothetical protein